MRLRESLSLQVCKRIHNHFLRTSFLFEGHAWNGKARLAFKKKEKKGKGKQRGPTPSNLVYGCTTRIFFLVSASWIELNPH